MLRAKIALAFTITLCAGEASAQTSNCMSMGPDMVNCTNADGSTTNCMNMGPSMANCQTTGGTQSGGGDVPATAPGWHTCNIVCQLVEASFHKHIKQMLDSGDCQGAVNYAIAKGRLATSNAILQSCGKFSAPQPLPVAAMPPADLPAMVQKAADLIHIPMPLSENVTLVRVEPMGIQLLLTARVDASLSVVSDEARRRVQGEMCGHPVLLPLLQNGAFVRIVYVDKNDHDIGAVTVTKQICGF